MNTIFQFGWQHGTEYSTQVPAALHKPITQGLYYLFEKPQT